MPNSAPIVLINREGGTASAAGAKLPDQVAQAFAKAGAHAEIRLLAASEMGAEIQRAAANYPRITVGGGDGTIAAAAQLLAGGPAELALLPLGTRNHFARDLAIPVDLESAARLAVEGKAAPIDLGEVNDRYFINNASVGLYPFMVKHRDRIRDRHGWPKWLASVPASWDAFSRLRNLRLRVDLGHGEQPVTTPLLFVGNNRYSLESGSVGARDSLCDGVLSVYAVTRSSRAALLWFGVRAMVGLTDRTRDFEALGECYAFTVQASDGSQEIALDGELRRLRLPLRFAIHAGALRVVVPIAPRARGKAKPASTGLD